MHDLNVLDPEDRDAALERGFTQHDTLSFRGKPLRPLTIATWRLLQRSGNQFLLGRTDDPLGDSVGFILLHSLDEEEHKKARAYVWRGTTAWNEYIHEYLDANPDIMPDVMEAAPMLRQMVQDFLNAFSKSISGAELKKKSGDQDG
jgi:hypothetical protein